MKLPHELQNITGKLNEQVFEYFRDTTIKLPRDNDRESEEVLKKTMFTHCFNG